MVNVGDQAWVVEITGIPFLPGILADRYEIFPVMVSAVDKECIFWDLQVGKPSSGSCWISNSGRRKSTDQWFATLLEAKAFVMKRLKEEKDFLQKRLAQIDEGINELVMFEEKV